LLAVVAAPPAVQANKRLPIWEVDVSWGYLPLEPGKQTTAPFASLKKQAETLFRLIC